MISVDTSNDTKIVITFSGPIVFPERAAVFDEIKINGAKLVGTAKLNASKDILTIEYHSRITQAITLIEIAGIKDTGQQAVMDYVEGDND